MKFGIQAKRPNGETVFLVENSNGKHMLPSAYSLAVKFDSKREAKREIPALESRYVGLYFFTVFQFIA